MSYSATYASTDIAPASIDLIVTVLAAFASLATIVGLILLWGFFKKHMR